MPRSDRVLADAEALLQRVSPEGRRLARRARERRLRARLRTGRQLLLVAGAIILAAIAWGLAIGPIGQFGFLAALAAFAIATAVIVARARVPEETPARLATSDLADLPARTEAWLQRWRSLLPPSAVRLADEIGVKLETLAPQLAALDPAAPEAAGVRKLLSQELPDLIEGYGRVPADLRKTARDGPAPDRQLIDGLATVDQQLGRISAALADGDLQRLATQNRYLELKYRDE